jgi:hypothetical protein
MKRLASLLAVAMLTATSAGCNCCPCLRNICPLSCCGGTAPAPVATYAAVPACPPPAPVCGPSPVFAAAPTAMPVYAATPQQYTVPQYAAPAAQPVYSEAGCGAAYAEAQPCVQPCMTCPQQMSYAPPMEMGCGIPSYSMSESACPCEAGYGSAPAGQMMVDPGPAQ